MIRLPPGSTRTDTLLPYTTLFRSQQRLDVRLVPGEVHEQLRGVLAAAARQQRVAEAVAVLALQAAVVLDPLRGVRVQHLRPDVRVVARRIPAHDVVEVG